MRLYGSLCLYNKTYSKGIHPEQLRSQERKDSDCFPEALVSVQHSSAEGRPETAAGRTIFDGVSYESAIVDFLLLFA